MATATYKWYRAGGLITTNYNIDYSTVKLCTNDGNTKTISALKKHL